MKRMRLKVFLWSLLLVSVLLRNVESSTTKRGSPKPTKSASKPQLSTTATDASTRSTTVKSSSSRNTPRPKGSKRTTTSRPSTTASAMDLITKLHGSSTASTQKRKQNTKAPATTTTLSPSEVMNRLYQMHGLASHGISASHSAYSAHTSTKKKEQHQGSSMDDIYRLHALAIAQGSHGQKKASSFSESSSTTQKPVESSNPKQSYSKHNSMEHIYQQHSSLPSSMHHIMAQHSVSSHSSSSRPQKTSSSSSSVQESSGSSLSTLMQPLLKQLTPVGAGIGVVLAPLLLFNGFLQFFSNMSRFLNNFAQTILPVRRPMDQAQNQNNYFQNLGPAHLKRQPRDWYINPQNMEKIQELTELFMKALSEAEVQ